MRAVLFLAAAGLAWAQQPRITNAKFDTRAVAAGLEREFQSIAAAHDGAAWIGYAVHAIPGQHQMCCYSSFEDGAGSRCCRGCALEGARAGAAVSGATPAPIQLEGGGDIFVLFRIENRAVDRIRTFSADCELDGGGLPFHWLTGVPAAESVTFLTRFARDEADDEGRHRRSEPAIAAIALHADSAADQALETLVTPSQPESLREKATFWLGSARSHRGYEVLRRIVAQDPSEHVREKAIFGLSVTTEPEAVATMIEVAKNDRSTHVRGQALFWLAHKAGQKAATAITAVIDSDPDTDVKKKAVFALQQLPPDEGVPLLIQVARGNKNPAVRKQAMFWLGQSQDPRAVQFFEEILLR